MTVDWKKLSPVLTLSVLGLMCASVLLAIFLGPRLLAYELSRRVAQGGPLLMIVPQRLPESRANPAPGMTLSRFRYQFEVPWNDLNTIDDHKLVSVIVFKSGRSMLFMDPKQQTDRMTSLRDAARKEGNDPVRLFGPEVMASNYNFVRAILSVTPQRFSFLSPVNEMVRNSALLMMKNAETTNVESGLYSVSGPGVRGFQKGNPSARDGSAILQMFDEQDHEIFLTVSTLSRTDAPVTQGDLNRIVQTLRPIADAR